EEYTKMRRTFSNLLRAAACGAFVAGAVLAAPGAGAAPHLDHPPRSYVGAPGARPGYFPPPGAPAAGGAAPGGAAAAGPPRSNEPSHEIWDATVEGDYVVTPDQIEGHRPVAFVGR